MPPIELTPKVITMYDDSTLPEQLKNTCPAFCDALTHDEIVTFLRFTSIRDVESRGVVADVGEVGDQFYLVMEGEVRLSRQEGKTEIEVGRISPGGLVGEMSFFDRQPRTVRLRASKKGARLVVITRTMYKRMTIEHPFVAVNLLEFVILSLDKLIRSTSQDITSMHKQMTGVGYR
jgi:CRP-like cAMP-binding protein